jgi:hypothetical protein
MLNTLGSNATTARYSARPAVRWAISPDFYALLLPRLGVEAGFPLGSSALYVSRERVHAVIAQAFDVWQANSPSIRFVDVTERCTAERLWLPVEERQCYSSPWCVNYETTGPLGDNWEDGRTDLDATSECTFATCLECERADIVVGGFFQHNRGLADHVEARVTNRMMLQMPPVGYNGRPVAGQTLEGAGGTGGLARAGSGAFLQFNLDNKTSFNTTGTPQLGAQCWRLDSDFCGWLAGLETDPYTTAAFCFGLGFALCCCVFLYGSFELIRRLTANLLQGWDMDSDGKLELQEVVYVMDEFCGTLCFECRCPTVHSKEMSPLAGTFGVLETLTSFYLLPTIVTLATMIALPLAFFAHVAPCWSCHDLRAAAVHEIGHALGLSHADSPRGVTYDASAIDDCLAGATGLLPYTTTESLMSRIGLTADTMLAPRRCLTQDDLNGLNFLYPTCGGDMLEVPTCPVQYGDQPSWLRLLESFLAIAWPVLLAIFGIKLLALLILWMQDQVAKRRLRDTSKEIVSHLATAVQGKDSGAAARPQPESLQSVPRSPPAPT